MDINNINSSQIYVNPITPRPTTTYSSSSKQEDPTIGDLSDLIAGYVKDNSGEMSASDKKTFNELQGIDADLDDIKKKLDDVSKMNQDEIEQRQAIIELLNDLSFRIARIQEQLDKIFEAQQAAEAFAKKLHAALANLSLLKNQIDEQREQTKFNNDLLSKQKGDDAVSAV